MGQRAKAIPRVEREKTEKSPGSKGWKIAKFHASSFFSGLVLKFGMAKTFDSGANEKHHKYFVKGNAKLTQRISSKFASQLSRNDYDRVVIDRVFEHIKHHCTKDHSPVVSGVQTTNNRQYYSESDSDSDDSEDDHDVQSSICQGDIHVSGCYDMTVNINVQNRVQVKHKWVSPYRQALGVTPNVFVGKTVADAEKKYHMNNKLQRDAVVHVSGYTCAQINGCIYKSNPFWKGDEWYDWACVQFPETVTSTGGDSSICRIMGFIRYKDTGALTFHHMEQLGLTPENASHLIDHTLYVVVHCQTQYFSYSRLQSQFFRKFVMEDADKMRILPATCIKGPVLVIPDIIDANTASSVNYLSMLPRHKMGVYWLHHLNAFLEDSDDDDMDELLQDSNVLKEEELLYGDNWKI